jgi:hypothetical protein
LSIYCCTPIGGTTESIGIAVPLLLEISNPMKRGMYRHMIDHAYLPTRTSSGSVRNLPPLVWGYSTDPPPSRFALLSPYRYSPQQHRTRYARSTHDHLR